MDMVGFALEAGRMSRKITPLPPALIPFILDSLDGFDVVLEDDERIVITPKEGAKLKSSSRKLLADALLPPSNGTIKLQRRKIQFTYRVADRQHTPDQAKKFGLSVPRLAIYTIIYGAGDQGAKYQLIREKSKLPHGSVQQVLHWLRKQKLITAEQDPAS